MLGAIIGDIVGSYYEVQEISYKKEFGICPKKGLGDMVNC